MRRMTVVAIIVFALLAPIISISCDTTQEPEAEALIGPEGGVVEVTNPESPIYGTRIEIPPGALTEEATVSIDQATFDLSISDRCESESVTPAILIEPDNIVLGKNCTITLPYDDLDDDGFIDGTDFSERSLSVYFALSGSEEAFLANDCAIDTDANVIHISTDHFSKWRIRGQRWNSGVTVNYYIDSVPGNEDYDESLFDQEIADAFLMWQTALDDLFTFAETENEDDADIVFRAKNFCGWTDLLDCDAAATTSWYLFGYSVAGKFTIYFNTHPGGELTKWIADDYCDFPYYTGPPFLRVVLHEVGHALGLPDMRDKLNAPCFGHTACNPACDTDNRVIMRYDDWGLKPFTGLSCLDIGEVRSHYGLTAEECEDIFWSDDFEYADSLENHGWTIETSNPQGDPRTATDPENGGNRVAYIQSRQEDFSVFPAFYRSFSELPLQPGMEISIRFYDSGDSCGNCDVWTQVFFDNDSDYLMVGWYNNPSSFAYAYEISDVYSGELHEAYGLRGIGWHEFVWRVEESGGIDLLIDGNLIIDDLTGVATLSKFRVGSGSDDDTYSFSVDDFAVASPG